MITKENSFLERLEIEYNTGIEGSYIFKIANWLILLKILICLLKKKL